MKYISDRVKSLEEIKILISEIESLSHIPCEDFVYNDLFDIDRLEMIGDYDWGDDDKIPPFCYLSCDEENIDEDGRIKFYFDTSEISKEALESYIIEGIKIKFANHGVTMLFNFKGDVEISVQMYIDALGYYETYFRNLPPNFWFGGPDCHHIFYEGYSRCINGIEHKYGS